MDIPILYRRMKQGEEPLVFAFISSVFQQFVAPEFSQQGIDEFMNYIQPDALEGQLKGSHFAFVAVLNSEIIGIIEVRDFNHVALFFVASQFQRIGVGSELFRKALENCVRHDVNLPQITVNASPNSVNAYEKMGFKPTDIEQCVNGIRFVPMALCLQQTGDGKPVAQNGSS